MHVTGDDGTSEHTVSNITTSASVYDETNMYDYSLHTTYNNDRDDIVEGDANVVRRLLTI